MRNFFSAAPGAVWAAIIIGLSAGAVWLTDYYSDLAWVPPLAGLLIAVVVPVLKVFAQDAAPATRHGEVTIVRSRFSRWLW